MMGKRLWTGVLLCGSWLHGCGTSDEIGLMADDASVDMAVSDDGRCGPEVRCEEWSVCEDTWCVPDASDRNFAIRSFKVFEPAALAPTLNTVLGEAIARGGLAIGVHVGARPTDEEASDLRTIWLASFVPTGAQRTVNRHLPALQVVGRVLDDCPEGAVCYGIEAPDISPLRLPLPGLQVGAGGCQYTILDLVASGRVTVYPHTERVQLDLDAVITRPAAILANFSRTQLDSYGVPLLFSSPIISLEEILEMLNIAPNTRYPAGSDGPPNGWRLTLQGAGPLADIVGDPNAQLGVLPPGCDL